MFSSPRPVSHGLKRASRLFKTPSLRRGISTEADIEQARKYCVNQLRQGDYDAYLIRQFVPRSARDAYDAIRTLNLELARLPESVSSPTIGQFRTQFWKDTVARTFAGNPPREPISILLHKAIVDLSDRAGPSSTNSLKFWLLRMIRTREQHMENKPFISLAALEEYGENTYATLMYVTLAAMPLRSVHMDHLASHIGKACGIVATLRGLPILAAPSQPIRGPAGSSVGNTRNPAVLLPLDIMAEVGLREEDVFRKGPNAEGLQDAVFRVATRANDHLITAREMLKNLKAGESPGHDYEHEGEAEHVYSESPAGSDSTASDLRRGFGVLLESIPAADYLQRLEGANFDPFQLGTSWKLPWKIWRALKTEQI
ncbi:Squalene/phytoene synthase [Rhypophila decipiens]|uniref:Squalene/phytoene synthase n=1 Tax=Rhypophila decipiens TaxID=261697 RepID=A0AAN7B423_9PEZI|nr:Squalene/phytoene synthase [Rhypophila decipiens]